ncbi:MAG TPA: universal stress protein [Solirubrobacteraceae bacterium]|nr:universal stress protein [Solirubrobacteraceae bacterium]
MSTKIVVSYDGTYNEDDAVALGRLFAHAGAEVSLAYVRHVAEVEASREILAQHEAEALLQRGAEALGNADIDKHVVTDRSTPDGLRALAERIGADALVFCSDSHTAQGRVAVGNSARRLLEGGPVAVAIAPAGFAKSATAAGVRNVGVVGDGSAHATAEALAGALGAQVVAADHQALDALVVGSRPEAEQGRVSISAASENLIENAASPVLVVAHGRALSFDSALATL